MIVFKSLNTFSMMMSIFGATKISLLLVIITLICYFQTVLSEDSTQQTTPITSEAEFLHKLNDFGPLDADQVSHLLDSLDSDLDLEVAYIETDSLVALNFISNRFCDFHELRHRMRICSRLGASGTSLAPMASANLVRFCEHRIRQQLDLCLAQTSQLLNEAIGDLSRRDRELALNLIGQQQQAVEYEQIKERALAAAAHNKHLGQSCANIKRRFELLNLLYSTSPKRIDDRLGDWIALYKVCSELLKD